MQKITENKNNGFGTTLGFVTGVLSVAFSMGACSEVGCTVGIISALLVLLLSEPSLDFPLMPVYMGFSTVSCAALTAGSSAAGIAVFIAGLLLIISRPFAEKLKKYLSEPCIAGLMLSGALTVTVMQTNTYFSIGAVGMNVRKMLIDYVSRGFHANWRGVLYGTIVMVIMITFPRKFKKASLYVRPAFLALIATLILNLFLNPEYMPTAIAEVGGLIPPALPSVSDFHPVITGLLFGVALWLQLLYIRLNDAKSSITISGIFNILVSPLCGAFLPTKPVKRFKRTAMAFLTGLAISAVLFVLLSKYTSRTPLPSCAVVLIVGTWQAVNWKKLKNAFSSVKSVIIFTVAVLAPLLTDIATGTIIAVLVGSISSLFKGSEERIDESA